MSHVRVITVALVLISTQQVSFAYDGPQADREATIQPDTRARLTLQTEISSKLSEEGDAVVATLTAPVYVDGRLVLPRGAEFHGKVGRVKPAKRGQRASRLSIVFDHVATQAGNAEIVAQVTAVDDWRRDEKLKADGDGTLDGGHRGDKTVGNVTRGAQIGYAGFGAALALGGAAGAGPRQLFGIAGGGLAASMIAGLLLTKGGDIRLAPGTILRIKFTRPVAIRVPANE